MNGCVIAVLLVAMIGAMYMLAVIFVGFSAPILSTACTAVGLGAACGLWGRR